MTRADADSWIVLDAVGTLFRADPPVPVVYSAVAREFGVGIEPGDVAKRFRDALQRYPSAGVVNEASEGVRWADRVRDVFAEVRVENFDELFDALWHRFAAPDAWLPFDDVEAALVLAPRSGHRLAVASNFDGRLIPIVEALFPGRFDAVLPATSLGAAKPDVAFFRAVESRLAASPSALHLVGDDPRDDEAGALAAGWTCRLVSSDPRERNAATPRSLVAAVASLAERGA